MKSHQQGLIAQALLVVVLLLGLGAGLWLSQQSNNPFSKAAPKVPDKPETSFELELEKNAELSFPDEPNPDGIPVNNKFRVDIYTRSDNDEANLFAAKIKFFPESLKVIEINKRGGQTFAKNWVESFYDNSEGEISIVGGVTTPGIKTDPKAGALLMASIIFEAKKVGEAKIEFTDSSGIYRNIDNINIISAKKGLTFSIKEVASSSATIASTSLNCKSIIADGAILSKKPDGTIEYIANGGASVNFSAEYEPLDRKVRGTWNLGIGKFETTNQDNILIKWIAPASSSENQTGTLTATLIDKSSQQQAQCPEVKIIVNAAVTASLTLIPAPSASSRPQPRRDGDINSDGKFDLVDISAFLTYFGKNDPFLEADLNGDGRVSVIDYSKLLVILTEKGVIKDVYNKNIDTLEYFLTNHPDKGLDGEHTQNYTDDKNGHPLSQTIQGNKAYYVKWAPEAFEILTWDNNFIYLKEDHSGAPVNIYAFNPGIWMKRSMQIGETIDGNSNTIQWYDNSCQKGNSGNYPIKITLEKHEPNYNIGGDLGVQDVIVLKYDSSPGNANGVYERFYYSKEWGWIRWEEYLKNRVTDGETTEGTLSHRRTFNKIIAPIAPDASVSCTEI